MNTTIQPAVFQDIGAQILKRPPSDTETFTHDKILLVMSLVLLRSNNSMM